MSVTDFIEKNYRHFNASTLREAARGYKKHLDGQGKMLVTLAGAMSTAELGITLADMIREGKVHAISCTGANLEEDIFHLVAADSYKQVPNWRDLSPKDDYEMWKLHQNRVCDVCIPEEEAMRVLERALDNVWKKADMEGKSFLPHEFWYQILDSKVLEPNFKKDPKTSWLLAACEKKIPIFVPGAEDSTTGNMFAGRVLLGQIKATTMKSGMEYMVELMKWYRETSKEFSIGMFQIGGGIAGDFPACVVPTLNQDFRGIFPEVPFWGYHCQITDAVTSYGGFSGCTPSEKITWGKLSPETPNFMIESDATIVAPLIFYYILGR